MTWLLLATGCTGGLTLVFLFRLLTRLIGCPASIQSHFAPGKCLEPLVNLVGKARREVLLLARSVGSPALAQALVDAKLRGVKVEIVLDPSGAADPTGDFAFLVDQSLAPVVRAKELPPLHEYLMIVDDRFVATGSFPFTQQAEEKQVGHLVIVGGHPDFAQACRAHFQEQRGGQPAGKPPLAAPAAEVKVESPSAQLSKEPEKALAARLGKAREALEAATGGAVATDGKQRLKIVQREEAAASS